MNQDRAHRDSLQETGILVCLPGLELYLRDNATMNENDASALMLTPEYIPLHLPSSLSSEKRPSVCVSGLAEVEDRLRFEIGRAHV